MAKKTTARLLLPATRHDPEPGMSGGDENPGELAMLRRILHLSSHHFNNLLAPMMTYPDLIRLNYHDREKVFRYLQAIETATRTMADRNRDILVLGRRGSYRRQTFDVNLLINRLLQDGGHGNALSIERYLAPDLFPLQGGYEELERVIYHLVRNARQAMRDAGVLTVKTENYYLDRSVDAYGSAPAGEYVKITVSDTGPGIDEENLQTIRDSSTLADWNGGPRGLALGLRIVADVVRNHGGYLDVEVRKGSGTSFYIYLPVARQLNLAGISEEEAAGAEKILIVDDDPGQRELCSRILSSLGYQVSTVQSGEEAVASCERSAAGNQPFNLLVMDLVMDGMSAVETYRAIKGIFPGQKAILLSGYTPAEAIKVLQTWGAGPYVKKPIETQRLIQAVRLALMGTTGGHVH